MDESPKPDSEPTPPSGPQREPGSSAPASAPLRAALVVIPVLLAAYWGPLRKPAPLPPPPPAAVQAVAKPAPPAPKPSVAAENRASSLDFLKPDAPSASPKAALAAPAEPVAVAPPDAEAPEEPSTPAPAPPPSAADEIEAKAGEAVNGEPYRERTTFQAFVFGSSQRIGGAQSTGAYYFPGEPTFGTKSRARAAAQSEPSCPTCGNFRRVPYEVLIKSCHNAYLGTKNGRAYVCAAKSTCCSDYMGTIGGGSCRLVP